MSKNTNRMIAAAAAGLVIKRMANKAKGKPSTPLAYGYPPIPYYPLPPVVYGYAPIPQAPAPKKTRQKRKSHSTATATATPIDTTTNQNQKEHIMGIDAARGSALTTFLAEQQNNGYKNFMTNW